MRERHPNFTLERGSCVIVRIPGTYSRVHTHYQIVGRLENGTPFLLDYAGGSTHWLCNERLGNGLRRKILSRVRTDIRHATQKPDYITVHDFREIDDPNMDQTRAVRKQFFDEVWRAQYLNDRDEDYIDLAVPFAEKDKASELGAIWDGERRVWKVRRDADLTSFERWLPTQSSSPTLT